MNTAGWPYEDIVNMPRHVSERHTPMPALKRAAQFMPFAALTGYEDAVAETARLTDDRPDLTQEYVSELNRKLNEALANDRDIQIVYFVPDEKKNGGAYMEVTGKIRKIEFGEIFFSDGTRIPAGNVIGAGEP